MIKFFVAVLIVSLAAGCAGEHAAPAPNPDIPTTALLAKQGGGRMFFQATDPGVLYVYDADTTQLVFYTPIKLDQRFVLDVNAQRATVEGKAVFEKPIERQHTYRIYIDPNGTTPEVKAVEVAPPITVNAKSPTTAPAE